MNEQRAQSTGEKIQLSECGLVLESLGYFPIPILGIPFVSGKLLEFQGRIINKDKEHMEGLYASGWFKRGSSGIIGTNVWDAQETSRSLISDLMLGKIPLLNRQPMYDGIYDLLKEKGLESKVSSWQDWMKIESAEEKIGSQQTPPKPREKFLTAREMNDLTSKNE